MSSPSSIRDNRPARGRVGDFLKSEIQPGSDLSFVSAYFTVHAYAALAKQLEDSARLRFLFGEPSFISGIGQDEKKKANFKLTETGRPSSISLPRARTTCLPRTRLRISSPPISTTATASSNASKEEVLDLEDLDEEMISLADLSLTDFRLDLLRYLETNRELLETAGLGLFAVVPPDLQLPVSQPGILFCLRQRDDTRPVEVNFPRLRARRARHLARDHGSRLNRLMIRPLANRDAEKLTSRRESSPSQPSTR